MSAPDVAAADRREAPGPELYFDDWLWTKVMPLTRGEVAVQHVHEFDHPTIIATGRVWVWINDEERGCVSAPSIIHIKAGEAHRFVAVEDSILVCVHNLRGEGYPAVKED